ncbi:hypothetical protein Tco_1031884 [Tanacetum coccineum]|uniref:Uncharacterized protein n=1 Tax=Tanacetum coccineum TaxID=301880 RepID=A0ABQ5GAA2_9ASTR
MDKGETTCKPKYGMKIPEAMLSQTIKEIADYRIPAAFSHNIAPIRCSYSKKGTGKDYMRKDGVEINVPKEKKKPEALELVASINLKENKQREKEQRSKVRHDALVLDKEVDEAYNDQMKLKLKAVEQITKGPGEGSSAVPDSPDHSDSSDTSVWESSDDDKIESDNCNIRDLIRRVTCGYPWPELGETIGILETDITQKDEKTKPKTTKLSTEWKGVKKRSQIEAKKSTKSRSQQKSQTVKVKVNPDKVKSTPRS